jgi:hypothetical protein
MKPEIEKYIANNYYELLSIAKKYTKNNKTWEADELLHEIILQIYERKSEIILKEYDDNSIKYFIISVIALNWKSKTSPWFYKMRKESINYIEFTEDHEVVDDFDDAMDRQNFMDYVEEEFSEMNWFSKLLFTKFLTYGSIAKTSRETKIPATSVSGYIKKTKKELKERINNRMK